MKFFFQQVTLSRRAEKKKIKLRQRKKEEEIRRKWERYVICCPVHLESEYRLMVGREKNNQISWLNGKREFGCQVKAKGRYYDVIVNRMYR